MKHLKHFVADDYFDYNLILERKDWSTDVWKAFLDIFELKEAEKIEVREYKITAYSNEKEN